MTRTYRAISPVIATIIIIAVTIAIAVAVAGWLMGLWGGFTTRPALRSETATLYTNGTLVAIIKNEGQGDAVIYAIEVNGRQCIVDPNQITVTPIVGKASSKNIIKAGETVKLVYTCDDWKEFVAGSQVQWIVLTKDGSKFGPFVASVVAVGTTTS